MDDVGTGAVRYLSQFADVTSLLGFFPVSDPNPSNAGQPWLFSDTTAGVLARLEGTSQCAVVCSDFGGWTAPAPLGTGRFRRLRVDIWVDPLRDVNNNVLESSSLTTNRGLAVFNAVQFRLHRTNPDTVTWGDLVTYGCQLLTEPQFTVVPDGDYLQSAPAYFGVMFSGWTDASE